MDQKIWKQPLLALASQEIMIPEGAEILCAREQFADICVWFRCDPKAQLKPRKIEVIATGDNAPNDGRYLGTAYLNGGSFVLHVFEGA